VCSLYRIVLISIPFSSLFNQWPTVSHVWSNYWRSANAIFRDQGDLSSSLRLFHDIRLQFPDFSRLSRPVVTLRYSSELVNSGQSPLPPVYSTSPRQSRCQAWPLNGKAASERDVYEDVISHEVWPRWPAPAAINCQLKQSYRHWASGCWYWQLPARQAAGRILLSCLKIHLDLPRSRSSIQLAGPTRMPFRHSSRCNSPDAMNSKGRLPPG